MMLPSLGHFSEVPCVFYLNGSCSRPHCHFRHCKQDKTNDDGKPTSVQKTDKDTDSEWLGPNLRLSHVTHMVEKAVDRALLANPDKKLDRATMISQALETLRREGLANQKNTSSPSTSAGFPSYKPTPISILNKRHIPVVAMPAKPLVVRKDKRPEEKPAIGLHAVDSSPPNITSHNPKHNVQPPLTTVGGHNGAHAGTSSSECDTPLIQQISDFLGTEMETNSSSKTATNDTELDSPGHSNSESRDTNDGMENYCKEIKEINQSQVKSLGESHVQGNESNLTNVNPITKDSNTPLTPAFEADEESVVRPNTIITDRCEGIDLILNKESTAPKTFENVGITLEPLPPRHKNLDQARERSSSSKESVERHTADSKKSTSSHKKSEKPVHYSSKCAKNGKSGHEKYVEEDKRGGDGHRREKLPNESEKESHKKSSSHNMNLPGKNQPTDDHSTKKGKEHDEKKGHQKFPEKNDKKQKSKHHHSHKHNSSNSSGNDKKAESHGEKPKSSADRSKSSKHSSSSHKPGSSGKHSSSHSKDRHKGKKRKADEEREICTKTATLTSENIEEKKIKLESKNNSHSERSSQKDEVGARPRRASGSTTRERVKRKHHSDSDEDFDFVDLPSLDHADFVDLSKSKYTAIVISSSSSDECQNERTSSPVENQHISKSEEEDADNGVQTTVVDFKWSKAKEIIQRSTHSKMPRIAHVPNVMNILTAKTRLLSREKTPVSKSLAPSLTPTKQSVETDEGPQPKTVKRVAHGSQGAENRPVVKHLDNVKLPPGIRQHYCNVFYDELCKYLDPEKARRLAVEEELDIAKRCKIHKIYQNNCSLLLLKIRKMKGNIGKGEQAAVKWTGSSTPEFTYGLTLYKCFEKYLLPEEELVKNGYPMPLPGQPNCAYIEKTARKYSVQQPDEPFKRRCVNCRKTYEIDQDGMPTTMNDCNYHWGRMRKVGGRSLQIEKYTCCDGADDSLPCQSNAYHVWSGKNEDCIPGFVKTREWPDYKDDSDAGVYALDCEMCYTTRGLELARLTVIDLNEDVIFDEVIALDNPVLDYCTRFSGIDEDKMRQATLTFQDVQSWVLDNFFDKTILIGHSLENDLNALKVFHKRIVDTSVTFPHKFGPPMKNSLKNLAMSMLALPIQENEKGHDSKEDAVACLRLMMKRIKEDAKVRKPRVIIGYAGKKR